VISAIVAVVIFLLVITVIVIFAREPGPTPPDIAIAYELAWDRLDFDTLWALSGPELRDGLDKREYIAAKTRAYEGRHELRNLADHVDIDDANIGIGHAAVRTRVTLRDGAVVRNDVVLTKRSAAWVVTAYQLVANPPQTV
jgi:hypothetical protein